MKPLVNGHPAPGECWEELAEHSITHDDLPQEAMEGDPVSAVNPLFGIPSFRCPACGKVSYLSRRDARRSARVLYPGRRMRTYRHLGRWHLTSQDAQTTAARRDHRPRRRQEAAA